MDKNVPTNLGKHWHLTLPITYATRYTPEVEAPIIILAAMKAL